MKKTYVFDQLDNVLGNYQEGKSTAEDVVTVALEVNKYLIENPHPDDLLIPRKVVCIAHPIGNQLDEVEQNISKIISIIEDIKSTDPDVFVLAPYDIDDCHVQDLLKSDPSTIDEILVDDESEGFNFKLPLTTLPKDDQFDVELRLYGDTLSKGMKRAIEIARTIGIKSIPMNTNMQIQYFDWISQVP